MRRERIWMMKQDLNLHFLNGNKVLNLLSATMHHSELIRQWREHRKIGSPIPVELWVAAVKDAYVRGQICGLQIVIDAMTAVMSHDSAESMRAEALRQLGWARGEWQDLQPTLEGGDLDEDAEEVSIEEM